MKKVLVADKDRQTLKMVTTMLTLGGYEVITAALPGELLALVKSERPDAVLLDYQLQEMHGGSLTDEIKTCDGNIEIIMMITYGAELKVAGMSGAEGRDYLLKPFSKEELLHSVNSLIYARRALSEKDNKPRILISSGDRAELAELRSEIRRFNELETIPLRKAYARILKDKVDVFIADVSSADLDVFDLLEKISLSSPGTDVLLISDSGDISFIKDSLRAGAFDCMTKPLKEGEIEKKLSDLFAKRRKRNIESVKKRYERELEKNREQVDYIMSIVESMIFALEARDQYTRGHSERVTSFAVKLAKTMNCEPEFVEMVRHASRLHDIGKIGIDDSILKKPSSLSNDEMDIMKEHPNVGENILKPVRYLSHILPIIRHHHERFDGGGYPDGLKSDEIPLAARIISVVDTFDAMRSSRPYRDKLQLKPVLEELERVAGSQLDPQIVQSFLEIIQGEEDFGDAYEA
ncbi:MAG: response regulator [bacterium]|nr:response regulator [bacterium]